MKPYFFCEIHAKNRLFERALKGGGGHFIEIKSSYKECAKIYRKQL